MAKTTNTPTRRDAAEAPHPLLDTKQVFSAQTQTELPKLLTTTETAQALGVSKRTLQELAAERKIAQIKFGRNVRFDPADIAAFIEANRLKAAGWKGSGK